MEAKYKRVVLKISGEAMVKNNLSAERKNKNFSGRALNFLADEIGSVYRKTELAIVIGGGNIIRGKDLVKDFDIDLLVADQMGMAATVINAIALQNILEKKGLETRVLSSVRIDEFAEPYIARKAMDHFGKGRIVILTAGTGNAGVTTDTAAVFKASDLKAGIIMKGTKVDGVYDRDPKYKGAKFLPKLTYKEFLKKELDKILDQTAVAQARMKKIPIFVFDIFKAGNLLKSITGEATGTLISESASEGGNTSGERARKRRFDTDRGHY